MAALTAIFNAGTLGGLSAGFTTAGASLGTAVHGPFFVKKIPGEVSGGAGTKGAAKIGDGFVSEPKAVVRSVNPRPVGPIGRPGGTQSVSEKQQALAVEIFTDVLKNLLPFYALDEESANNIPNNLATKIAEKWADQKTLASSLASDLNWICGHITMDETAWQNFVTELLAISQASSDGVRGLRILPKTAAQMKLKEFVVAQAEAQVLAKYPSIKAAYEKEFAQSLPVGSYTGHVYASILALILNPEFQRSPSGYFKFLKDLRGAGTERRFPIDAVLSFISQHFPFATTSQGAEVATPATEAAETSAKHPVGHKISFAEYLTLLQREETLAYAIVWYVSNYLPGEMGGNVSLDEDDKANLAEGIRDLFRGIKDPEKDVTDLQKFLADWRVQIEIYLKSEHTGAEDKKRFQLAIYAVDFFQAAYDHLSPRG